MAFFTVPKLLSLLSLAAAAAAQDTRPEYIVVTGSSDPSNPLANYINVGCLTAQGRVAKGNCGTFYRHDGVPWDGTGPRRIYSGPTGNKAMCTMLDTSRPANVITEPAGMTYHAMNCDRRFNGQFQEESIGEWGEGSRILIHEVSPKLWTANWAIPSRPTSAADEIPIWVWPSAVSHLPHPGLENVLIEFTFDKPF